MSKIFKNCYYTSNGEKKVNCYYINISRKIIEQALIDEKDELKVYVENGKIIIEKVK